MAIGCGRANTSRARGIGKGEPGRTLFRDQVEGRLDQRLAQIAVMIASAPARPLSRPTHVKCFYMSSGHMADAFSARARVARPCCERHLYDFRYTTTESFRW